MRIATFNINDVNKRLDNLIDWLAETQPDVVCLQELKAETGAFPTETLAELDYHAAWVGQRTWNGVAILARKVEPIVTRRRLPGGPSDDQARYIEAATRYDARHPLSRRPRGGRQPCSLWRRASAPSRGVIVQQATLT